MGSRKGEQEDLPGKEFESEVADAYRALGYRVTTNREVLGQQTDLVAQRDSDGAPRSVLTIECKDHQNNIGKAEVQRFINRVVSETASGPITAGVMVSRRGFTHHARAAGEDYRYVALLSWDELSSQIFDVRHAMRKRARLFEQSSIHHEYLPLGVELLSWSTLDPLRDSEEPELPDIVEKWAARKGSSASPGSLFVLADFGAGKTTLARYIEHQRALAHLAGDDLRIPLLVPLREYRDSQDVTALLRGSFRNAYHRDIPSDQLWSRLSEGNFQVLLDGFDEMVERSDGDRRLDLFYSLLDLLRSPSPTLLTSRRSYFVEAGEIERLLLLFREIEASIEETAWPLPGPAFAAADRIRRVLISNNREGPPHPRANDALDGRKVQVLRLLPLDRDRIESLVERNADELKRAGTSPAEVIDFIDRTYDLADLASRPLLLKLIIESIVIGRLEILDSASQLGASGLYEIYTDSKLKLDYGKGQTRRAGLSTWSRRSLAEALAVRMYSENLLETDFWEVFEDLLQNDLQARRAVESSSLSKLEIATDFATCSFVAIESDGLCRFIHKSFQGFFVARVLKDRLSQGHPLLETSLDHDVLYFLGGFAPTQETLAGRLWTKFELAQLSGDAHLQRNMLVAYLYTRPSHENLTVASAEIATAEFGRLTLLDCILKDVSWSKCRVNTLELIGGGCKEVRFSDSQVDELKFEDSELELSLNGSLFKSVTGRQGGCEVHLVDSQIESCDITQGNLGLQMQASFVSRVNIEDGLFGCQASMGERCIEELHLSRSTARLSSGYPKHVCAGHSLVDYSGPTKGVGTWDLTKCALWLRGETSRAAEVDDDELDRPPSAPDPDSVVIAAEASARDLIPLVGCGLFGTFGTLGGDDSLPARPLAWGVLAADAVVDSYVLPEGADGARYGRILLVKSDWYEKESTSAGCLSAVSGLRDCLASTDWPEQKASRLEGALATAKAQYAALLALGWPTIEALQSRSPAL